MSDNDNDNDDAVVGNTVVGNTKSDNIIMTNNPSSTSKDNEHNTWKNAGMEAYYGPEIQPPNYSKDKYSSLDYTTQANAAYEQPNYK